MIAFGAWLVCRYVRPRQ